MYVDSSWKSSQERAKMKGQSFQETVTGKLATYTKEHHWPSSRSYRNLTKNPPFCTWSSFPPSPLRWTSGQCSAGHRKRLLRPHFPLLQHVPAGEHWGNPAPLTLDAASSSTSLNPDDPEETKLLPAGHQAESEGKRPVPTGQSGVWRLLRAAREERAVPRSQTPEGSPRTSFAVSTQTGNPNWNGAKNLHDPAQHTAREQLIKKHT